MQNRKFVLGGILALALAAAGVVVAQAPGVDINPNRHPNLADAQHHIQQAYAKIDEAQKENRDELGGHGEKAKQLLLEADRELKLAADVSDAHHR